MDLQDRNNLTEEQKEVMKGLCSDADKVAMSAAEFMGRVNQRIIEEQDEFIFRTVLPFCQEVTDRTVNKRELEQALKNYYPKSRIYDKGNLLCPSCMCQVWADQKYCDNCGQHMEKIET